jgi:nitroreductase
MFLDQSAIALMQKRTSVRTYEKKPVEPEKLEMLKSFFDTACENPFGAKVRFDIVEGGSGKLGTYGFIKGAKSFFAGCVQKGEHDIEGFGYAFEKAVLYATALGLGTCWLGGTFKRASFTALINPDKDEIMPAISPVGYAAEKKTLTEKVVAAGAGARKRKRFGELFFDGTVKAPLFIDEEPLKTCLEMVRIGPSASNKQPWRVIRSGGALHFYLAADKAYAGNTMFGFSMQRVDLGIAACHFDMAAKELGLSGGIVIEEPQLSTDAKGDGWIYSFSWR